MNKTVFAFVSGIVLILVGGLAYVLTGVNWNRSVTIEGGPTIGFFYQTGQFLNDYLNENGIDSDLEHRDDTLKIIEDVNDPSSPVDIGFIAQSVDAQAYPNVTSLGSIVSEPLLFFVRADLAKSPSLSDLRGGCVHVGPPSSGVNALAVPTLKAYGFDPRITKFRTTSTNEGIEDVRAGKCDAVATLFPPTTPVIKELALDPRLRVIGLPDTVALASEIGYVQALELPVGSFSVTQRMPTTVLQTIGIPVTVIAKRSLTPESVFLVAERLDQLFSNATITSAAGQFPSFLDVQIPPNDAAQTFYEGGRPWEFSVFPGVVAELFDRLVLLISILLILSSIYKIFLPDLRRTWLDIIRPQREAALLATILKQRERGQPLSDRQLKQLRGLIDRRDRETARNRLIESLRHHVTPDPNNST
jgi:TRAP-type uncharacterized transport system substrate-binding protein